MIFQLLLVAIFCFPQEPTPQDQTQTSGSTKSVTLNDAVKQAFQATHQGWSSDELILNDELFYEFLNACRELHPIANDEQFGWKLLNLRKAGKLKVKTTRRSNVSTESVKHVAEIAARSATDQFGVSTDRIMVTPEFRSAFDELAKKIDKEADLYLVRRAAFRLRKTRKLKPELIARIVDWGRQIQTFTINELETNPNLLQEHPGIYIFRDKSGFLYIGQTDNLRERLKSHLDESHSKSLAAYLKSKGAKDISIEIHSFDPKSRANETMIRRAYESELIASRKPRFNVQP